jgi:thiamine transport system ATP-binding protein
MTTDPRATGHPEAMSPAGLSVDDLRVDRGGRPVVDGVSFSVSSGEVLAIRGPSGCGKSTLLAAIAGLVPVAGGRVRVDGRDVTGTPTHERPIGLVFQDGQLFPHRDVAGNLAYGLERRGVPRDERRHRVAELLELVGLSGFERRRVHTLSGGEARRVALARSLAPRPAVLLLDEPLTGLDPELHDRLVTEVGTILRSSGTTALWVTHDAAEADAIADRVLHMTPEGRLDGGVVIRAADPDETHDLRRRVLRVGTRTTEVTLEGDDGALHLVAERDGRIVAVSSWFERAHPSRPGRDGRQLRTMASAPEARGSGAAMLLLTAGLERARTAGADHVWARARLTALGFYLRSGFDTVGDEYVDESTGLPHVDILIDL